MKSEVIMNTDGGSFRCNNLIFDEYEMIITEQDIPYIKGKGVAKEKYCTVNDKKLIKDIFELVAFFENPYVVKIISGMNGFFKETEKYIPINIYFEEIFNSFDVPLMIDLYFRDNDKLDGKVTKEEIEQTKIKIYKFIDKCFGFIKKRGIPQNLYKEKGYNILEFIIKLNECYLFFKNVDDIKNNFKPLTIKSASFELMKDKNGVLKVEPFFEDLIEYAKFKVLIDKIIESRGVKECIRCHSLFIVGRSDQIYCSAHCKARYHEQKVHKNKNKERK